MNLSENEMMELAELPQWQREEVLRRKMNRELFDDAVNLVNGVCEVVSWGLVVIGAGVALGLLTLWLRN